MAPEVLNHQPYTAKCDIWSLGVIIYQMIFGEYPFLPKSRVELIDYVNNQNIKFPETPKISN
jgi:serine/threonine protein kinase